MSMVAGRPLVEKDFRAGSDPAALIGYNVWRDRFGSSPDAIGRQLLTETEAGRRESLRIAGVLPPNFYIGGESVNQSTWSFLSRLRADVLMVRLRRGVPPARVESRLTEAGARWRPTCRPTGAACTLSPRVSATPASSGRCSSA